MNILMRYVLTSALFLCLAYLSGCASRPAVPKQQTINDEKSFETLLDRTLDKINGGEAAKLTPTEFAVSLCFFPIDVENLRTLCGIEPKPGYFCFGRTKSYDVIEDAYLHGDLKQCDPARVRHLLTADYDAMAIVQRVCEQHDMAMSIEPDFLFTELNARQKNIVLAAHVAILADMGACNSEFLAIWTDQSQNSMVRDLCLEVALDYCDEASYIFIRDRLLDDGSMEVTEKINVLMNAIESPTPYSILFCLLLRTFEEKFQKEGYEQLVDDFKERPTMADFKMIGKIFGDQGILEFWIINRDYLYCEGSWLNTWQLDDRRKAADVLGGDAEPASLSPQQIWHARGMFAKFDSERLHERIGLTQKQMKYIPLEKLLLWDRLSEEEKKQLTARIP